MSAILFAAANWLHDLTEVVTSNVTTSAKYVGNLLNYTREIQPAMLLPISFYFFRLLNSHTENYDIYHRHSETLLIILKVRVPPPAKNISLLIILKKYVYLHQLNKNNADKKVHYFEHFKSTCSSAPAKKVRVVSTRILSISKVRVAPPQLKKIFSKKMSTKCYQRFTLFSVHIARKR